MSDPFDRATSSPPPTVGEGCTARYDPDALKDADGTDFPDAERLWDALQEADADGAREQESRAQRHDPAQ